MINIDILYIYIVVLLYNSIIPLSKYFPIYFSSREIQCRCRQDTLVYRIRTRSRKGPRPRHQRDHLRGSEIWLGFAQRFFIGKAPTKTTTGYIMVI